MITNGYYQCVPSLKSGNGSVLNAIIAIVFGLAMVMGADEVDGSDLRLQPSLILSEEYNDNILLTPENRKNEFITSISPALTAQYVAPNWDWDIAYNYNYRYFARATLGNDSAHTLNVMNRNRILSDVLFLDVKDQYTKVSLDVIRDYTQESTFLNQTDMNLLSVNPYIVLAPLSKMTITTGYVYMNTWYKDPSAIDRTDQIGYADARQDLSPRSAMTAGVRHTLDITTEENYTQDDLYLGFYYEYAEKSMITFKAGNSWFDFDSTGRTSQMFWDATITQRYPTLIVTYETGLRFIPDPLRNLRREDRYLLTIRKDIERTSLVVSGGIFEFREAEHEHLENTSYRMTGTISYVITTKSKIILNLIAERLDDNQTGASTDRYLTGVRFEHMAKENLALTMDYRYTNLYSLDNYSENYYNNRFTVELRKSF